MKLAERILSKLQEARSNAKKTGGQRQSIEKYKGEEFEIWHKVPKGYYASGVGSTVGEIALQFFDKEDGAIEHAQLEIDGLLGLDEKVEDNYFDEASVLADAVDSTRKKFKNKNIKAFSMALLGAVEALSQADEKGVVTELEAAINMVKKHKIEEAKIDGDSMVQNMKDAVKNKDQKALLRFMALDKKNFFSKKNLDMLADDKKISSEQASQLGKLSIEVAQALK